MTTTSFRSSRTALAATLAATALLASACGSDSQASGRGTAAGSTLTIGVSTPQTGPLAANNEAAQGLEAYFKARNAEGGVDGRTIKVKLVDNQSNVAGGATAMRSILASKPFAVSVLTTAGFTGSQSVLKSVPDVPALVLANGSAIQAAGLPNTFGLFTDYTTESFAGIEKLAGLDKTRLALVFDPTVGEQASEQDPDFAKKLGAEVVSKISVPATTTNYAPIVQKLRASGADAIVFQIGVQGLAGVMKAADQAGLDLPAVAHSGLLDTSTLELGGSALDGVYFTALFPLVTDTSPAVETFTAQMKKYAPNAGTVLGMVGWNAGALVEAALKKADADGDLTQKSFMTSLRGLGGQEVGVLKTIGWSNSDVHSIDAGNPDVFSFYRVSDGQFVKDES